ncbi:thioredoxin family protein [Candidatus Poribacteria bacterium]|nr:thioredoxin family protein [Candidatus Poribacteria bacterium]
MTRKPVFLVYVLLLFIPAFHLGAPVASYGQLSNFGLPKQRSEPVEIVTAHGILSVDKVQPSSAFKIALVMQIAEEWHANANPAGEDLIPTQITLPNVPDVTFGEIVYPKSEVLEIASIGKAPVYHGDAVIGIQATLSDTAKPRQMTLPLQLTYQACSDETCLLPKTIDVNVPIEVVGTNQSIQPINDAIFAGIQFGSSPDSKPVTSESGKFSRALSKGYFWAFLFVFLGGIATSLTPCVYPLIPITVGIFGANAATRRVKSFLLSLTYVFGILSMLGVFELRLPYAVQNKLNRVGGAGFGGAFAMGTVAGIIAAPCTGPALGAVLSYVATTGSVFLGFWLLLTYALGMGLLFILLGTFSGLIASLPRSGGWMYVLENIFGVAIIAMALYFLKEVIEPLRAFLRNSAGFFALAGVLLLVGVLLGKLTQRFKDLPRSVQFRKAFGILLAVIGLYMLIGGFTTVESQMGWMHDEAQGLQLARKEGKPVMLDFYATWCGACNELDKYTYSHPAVTSKLSKFVNIKLDFSKNSDEVERLKKKYGIVGLPVIIFFDSQGNELPEKRIEKFVESKEFLAHLEGIE